jgi:hypothetical protein
MLTLIQKYVFYLLVAFTLGSIEARIGSTWVYCDVTGVSGIARPTQASVIANTWFIPTHGSFGTWVVIAISVLFATLKSAVAFKAVTPARIDIDNYIYMESIKCSFISL